MAAASVAVVMVSLRKGNDEVLNGHSVTLTVQRNLLRTQETPFLDFPLDSVAGGKFVENPRSQRIDRLRRSCGAHTPAPYLYGTPARPSEH